MISRLLPVFQVLVLAATFVPAAPIVTRHDRPSGWIWPLPLIIIIAAVCAVALRREEASGQAGHDFRSPDNGQGLVNN